VLASLPRGQIFCYYLLQGKPDDDCACEYASLRARFDAVPEAAHARCLIREVRLTIRTLHTAMHTVCCSQAMKSMKELEKSMESIGNEVRKCHEGESNLFLDDDGRLDLIT
jgi:hypothetical protein